MAMESCVSVVLQGSSNHDKSSGWMNRHRLRQIDELIDERLDTQLTVSEVACDFGISAGFFTREFKIAFGRTPHQCIVDKRLASAREQLHQSQQHLSTIAFACGFSSHSHMTAQFNERLGTTPAQLRREVK